MYTSFVEVMLPATLMLASVDATATARANAILGGFLEPERGQLEELGFSEESIEELMGRKRSFFGNLFRSVIPG